MSNIKHAPRDQVLPGLKLKRRTSEIVVIRHKDGSEVKVQVVAFWTGPQVTLGFSGGKDFEIFRSEINSSREEILS